ncbi:hypothetical protein PVL29_023664 [Vitis rotundifolia]|uniref:40S ribosomal protein S29 n=1 Tax=Vitis rotundifolia TaxID=103349 RepID=A0AA39D8P1_VITRO|nr:hypothetical protein PVL29_023664 [Vitis rotundifolia]
MHTINRIYGPRDRVPFGHCGYNSHGLIRKYGLMCCRQCFSSIANQIGFVKGPVSTSHFGSACALGPYLLAVFPY